MAQPSEENRKLFQEFRAEALKRELAGSDNFDKAVLTLSSAGLGLSLTFMKDFGAAALVAPSVLYLSWVAFVTATLCTMASFLVSMKAQGVQLQLAQRLYMEGDSDAFDEANPWNHWTVWLNRASAVAFGTALVLTIAFVIYNMEERRTLNFNRNTSDLAIERRGATVPPMQRPAPPAPAPAPPPSQANRR